MSRDDQDIVHEYLGGNRVSYSPRLAQIVGVNASLVLVQLLYWNGKGARKDGWIYKTIEEMQEETALTRAKQDLAIKKLKEMGIISVELKGIPAKRHFKVNARNLLTCLKENRKLDDG